MKLWARASPWTTRILEHPSNLATLTYRAIIMIIIPVMITMIVAVVTASIAIKALITDIHRLYDDTLLDFRALHFRTLEVE